MMTPYEGERIFEAEMVRLHQCDRELYTCATQQQAQPESGRRSFWRWLLRGEPAPSSPQPPATNTRRTPG